MFDNVISNKYFIIALIIALIVVLYLYSQKKSCNVEGMKNVDLSSLSQEIAENPWTNDANDGKYKSVNNKFDRYADHNTKKKTGQNNFLKRKDEVYQDYVAYDGYEELIPENIRQKRKTMSMPINSNEVPKPLDKRPDLSQCQPCICPGDILDDDDDDEDDEYKYRQKRKRKNKKKID
jgi:hypothetical protein